MLGTRSTARFPETFRSTFPIPRSAARYRQPDGSTTTTTPASPAVEAIADAESNIATAANQNSASTGGGYSCSPNGTTLIGDIASTVDGGHSWIPDALPANAPQPMFTGISCPSVNECWAAGSDAVPQQIGNSHKRTEVRRCFLGRPTVAHPGPRFPSTSRLAHRTTTGSRFSVSDSLLARLPLFASPMELRLRDHQRLRFTA